VQIHGVEVLVLPSAPMSGVLEPRHAFNALIGNPNGYLPANSSVTRIEFALPPRDILPFGPAWIRPWWFVFFLVVVLTSFWLRWRWKLH